MKLKYKGRLGYLEARYRLGVGDKDKLLAKIKELKDSDIIETAKKLFEIK